MKKIFLFAAAALMFAACSSDDLSEANSTQKQVLPEGAIGFDAYIQRSTSSTRTGWVGTVTADALGKFISPSDLTKLGSHGFGVFGYYTDNNEYDPQSVPNFFYNQKVYAKTSDGVFEYEPIKYWPNEYGNNAISDDADKVTFFAYAPYVEVVPSTGKITASADEAKWGITGMSRNIANGDPLVKYLVSFDQDKIVDLCWGVCDDPDWATINEGNKYLNDGVKGKPWINVERPLSTGTDQKLKFTFKHALSQLNVTADTYADGTSAQSINAASRVYVRSITFTGFATKGTLNLNNEVPNKAQWLDYNGTSDLESGEEVTIYDGRKDGKEGTAGGIATNEKVLGLNPDFIQDENQLVDKAFIDDSEENYHSGVTGTAKNMFRKYNTLASKYVGMDESDPILVIPTGEKVKVTIVYDVETPSENLGVYLSDGKTPGSTIENRIEKEIDFGTIGMENGKRYTIHLHLGMNSVKVDADVTAWEDALSNEIDLPSNAPEFAAASGATYPFAVPAAGVNPQNIQLTGFNGGEIITPTTDGAVTASTGAQANADGVVDASFTVEPNNTVKTKTGMAKWAGSKQVQLNITQQPHALGLGADAIAAGAEEIFLTSTATEIDWSLVSSIKVAKNGVSLTEGSATPGHFLWTPGENKITLDAGEAAAAGDAFVITVKAGDAPEETIVKTLTSALSFSPSSKTIPYQTTTPTLDLSGYLKNITGSITWVSGTTTVGSFADASVGTMTIKDVGTTTITATDGTTSQAADLTIKIEKQPFELVGWTSAVTADSKDESQVNTSGIVIYDFGSSITTQGSIDAGATGTVTYTFKEASSGTFTVDSDGKVKTSDALLAGTYTITVTATGTPADADHYSAVSKDVVITLNVTTP